MRPLAKQSIALVCLVSFVQCNTLKSRFETIDVDRKVPAVAAGFEKIRIVVLPFKNSAQLGEFDIIADGDYEDSVVTRNREETPDSTESVPNSNSPASESVKPGSTSAYDKLVPLKIMPAGSKLEKKEPPQKQGEKSVEKVGDKPGDKKGTEISGAIDKITQAIPEPPGIIPGDLFREIAETELFQSGRFELVSPQLFLEKRKSIDPKLSDPLSALKAAQELKIQYLVSGDCTDFEIKQKRDYWKLPIWAIILVGSLFIKDDRLRETIWVSMARIAFVVPLNSEFWRAGVGWEDTELNVNVSVNMRLVSPNQGLVRFSEESSVQRTETVRNLDLLVWKGTNRLKIQKSTAGKQIRYVTQDLIIKLASMVDRKQLVNR